MTSSVHFAGPGDLEPAPPHTFVLSPGLTVEPTWYLHRQRLDSPLERLQKPDARVLVLWDAAGSGKTTLMAGRARRLLAADRVVEWISGADLNDPGVADEVRDRLTEQGGGTDLVGAGPRYLFVDDLHRAQTSRQTGAKDLSGLLDDLSGIPTGVRLIVSRRHRPAATVPPPAPHRWKRPGCSSNARTPRWPAPWLRPCSLRHSTTWTSPQTMRPLSGGTPVAGRRASRWP
ncbi:hypothetical protein [Cryobacterium sp.]|uniref:hypothetical protein n=1 Tax=Cryobacterium sp. TaxID=1926290 RepID=UPI002619D17D|nr:hypothetical protein [Cryobacterium sp.]